MWTLEKKGIGLPNIHVAVQRKPRPGLPFVVLGRGGQASSVQYKFQSMHPGGCNCVNSLFPAFNIFQSTHPGGCNCVNSLFPVFDIHIKRICLQVVSTRKTALMIAAVCSKVRRDSFLHSNIVDRKYISLTFLSRVVKYSCRRSKGSPAPRVYLLWFAGRGGTALRVCNRISIHAPRRVHLCKYFISCIQYSCRMNMLSGSFHPTDNSVHRCRV